jgi:endogenous inhibitor of DNA gyrase (YacG/DUF329 family)
MPDVPEAPEHSIAPAAPCPICGKPAVHEFRPFCSKRCADIDLGRWLKESYRVPTDEPPEDPSGDTEREPE